MSKDKKKKKKDKKDKGSGALDGVVKATSTLKAIAENPIVADIVAAALVSMAAALKDSDKARKLASQAGDQLGDMAKDGSDRGNVLWQLALDVGKRTLETLAGEEQSKVRKGK